METQIPQSLGGRSACSTAISPLLACAFMCSAHRRKPCVCIGVYCAPSHMHVRMLQAQAAAGGAGAGATPLRRLTVGQERAKKKGNGLQLKKGNGLQTAQQTGKRQRGDREGRGVEQKAHGSSLPPVALASRCLASLRHCLALLSIATSSRAHS